MSYFINLSLLRRNRNFRYLYTGQLVSFLGTMITGVALPYQIYEETHSTFMVGLLSLFQLIPLVFTALAGGVVADRKHRKKLLLITEVLLSLGCLLLAFNAASGKPHLIFIFLIASLMSAISGFHRPALESLTQQVVSKQDFLMVGALFTFKYSVSVIAGPAIAGLLIAHFGLVVTFIVDFATFFVSLITLILMDKIPPPSATQEQSVLSSLREGFRYAVSRQELLGSYFVDFIAMVFGMPTALFPALAQTLGGAKALGMLYAAPAVGALLISFFCGWTKQIKRHGAAIAFAAIGWGAAIILVGFSTTTLFWCLFFLVLAGAFDAISGIFRQTLWNETIPQHYRGRLAGIEMLSYMSGPKLGDTEAGMVAALFGVEASIISGGVLCIFGVAFCCTRLPRFWSYQSE